MTSTDLLAQAIRSLEDPKNPTFCCRYYICLLSHVEQEISITWENPIIRVAPYARDNLRLKLSTVADSTSLLDVLSAFIATNRSREDMATLTHRMERCECDRTDRLIDGMHAWDWNLTAYCRDPEGFRTRTCTFEGLIGIVAELFYNALQLHDCRRIRWPRTRRQCLVGSDESAATMLCRWLDIYPILPLLRAIAAAASSFGKPVLVPFLLSAHLPKNLVTILKRGVDSLPADFAGGFDPFGVVYPITLVFITMKELSNIDDGVSSAYFYREYCPLLLDTLSRVAEIDAKMAWALDFNWEQGINLGGIVHAKLVLPFDETKYHRRILDWSKRHRTSILIVQTPYQLARNIMLTLAELPLQCMSAECVTAYPPSICSGCKRVAYCNAECQTRDWNGPLPHKKVCKHIRALGDAAGFPVYADHYTDCGFIMPQLDVDEFQVAVQDGVPLSTVSAFNKNMIEDDRIRKVVNDMLVIRACWIEDVRALTAY
ncbi:hypothetical protein MSAN_00663700 [Mycena sanguinolenta]|uniref:MYND-type domain-containing protein n=1 Tax=Mycena sanguinolenta TaxID=230812 RepID=A0A8H6Z0B7_9AGAR|nr:hypothetical protein MSAN_00663700 [Mycena sanguinolenta]